MWTRDTKETVFMNLATAFTYKQTHPHLFYIPHAPGTWLIPQSITIAPGLIHSPFTISALPAATTRISALPTYKKIKKTTNNSVSHWQWKNAELLLQQVRSASVVVKLCSPIAIGGMEGHCQQVKVADKFLQPEIMAYLHTPTLNYC